MWHTWLVYIFIFNWCPKIFQMMCIGYFYTFNLLYHTAEYISNLLTYEIEIICYLLFETTEISTHPNSTQQESNYIYLYTTKFGTSIKIRLNRKFESTEFETMRINCMYIHTAYSKWNKQAHIFSYIQLHPLETMHYMYAGWHNFTQSYEDSLSTLTAY